MKRISTIAMIALFSMMAAGCSRVSTSGNYTLSSGRTLRGNLIITSGNAILEEGSRVTGDVFMTSGNLHVNGRIDGDIVFTSGQINLGSAAVVRGDVGGTSGSVHRAEGAVVNGRISNQQPGIAFGAGLFARLIAMVCLLPMLLIGASVFLIAQRRQNRPREVLAGKDAAAGSDAPANKLTQLKQLMDDGLISEADYGHKKAKILSGM